MGPQTLVDVVVKIMDFVSTTLTTIATAVENAYTEFVNGVKAAGQYIINEILKNYY